MDQLSTQTDYEFGGFRLDTVLQVLVSPAGEPIALPARAYDALRYLVERAGELVDRASLMRAVWPHTVVEDNSLNQCIVTLRRALGETAGERRFILTVPGRGFKFVAPVRAVPATREVPLSLPQTSAPPPSPTDTTPVCIPEPISTSPASSRSAARRRRLRRGSIVAAAIVLAVVLAGALALIARRGPVTVSTEYEALTDLNESASAPALSPDGRMLAFIGGDGEFLATGRVYVKLLPNGEPTPLTPVLGWIYGPAFSFDGTRVAFTYLERRPEGYSWDTWAAQTTGGQPALLLGNAAGLTWIGPHQLLYSAIRSGIHMGIVTSADDRAGWREIYLPAHERGMAHYSYLSPDRQSVLVVEMDRAGEFQRCRRVPFDGRSPGGPVGPPGSCISAAWSPDGRWMYFSAQVSGHWHLWRQRYPRGEAEQITFGPTEEIGVAVAPDGRSLVTSLGMLQQSIWLHDAGGERRITSETLATAPWLSPDAKRLYFLSARAPDAPSSLRRVDIPQGQQQSLLPGVEVVGYDISPDEREVAFSVDSGGEMQIWEAPLDHRLPPRLLARSADQPAFDGSGHIFFRVLGEKVNHLYRMQDDGSARQQMLDMPILDFHGVSPTGTWASVQAVIDGRVSAAIVGLGAEKFRWTREGYWPARWSADGRSLYLEVDGGRTLPIALTGNAPPRIPPLPLVADAGLLPHDTDEFAPGPRPDTYAFTRTDRLQNIYRIPLHR